ncbi:unnamed protein product [Cyprideis torosa]|uniref:Uncharacterized protein n=1 Tax=Cyprideis torosa TaxID=163714 RepID=A0A7R8WF63_9CRUS|nr:unnamed protein product [Cyprideis torosa]CAG0895107.1 unnamed protein product [Cyprideis torosa]
MYDDRRLPFEIGYKSYPKSRYSSPFCGIRTLRYLLILYDILLLVGAVVVLSIGLWCLFYRHTYVALLTTSVYSALPSLLIGVGLLVTLVVLAGCVAGCNENKCAALTFTLLLLFVLLLAAAAGFLSFLYSHQIESELKRSLNDTLMKRYGDDPPVTLAMDDLQRSVIGILSSG